MDCEPPRQAKPVPALDDRRRALGCEAVAVTRRTNDVGSREATLDIWLMEEAVSALEEPRDRRRLAARHSPRRIPSARAGHPEREPPDPPEAEAAHEAVHGHVALRGVESRDARTEAARALEAMRKQCGADAAPPTARVDAERMQPRLAVAEEGELRDADDLAVLDRDPQAAAPVARPVVEHVKDVVMAPDPREHRADGALVGRASAADLHAARLMRVACLEEDHEVVELLRRHASRVRGHAGGAAAQDPVDDPLARQVRGDIG